MPQPTPQKVTERAHHAPTHATEWAVGVVGLGAMALGFFLLLAGEGHYVGVGGLYSWEVSELNPAWGYSLIALGIVLAVAAGAMTRFIHHAGAHLASYRKLERDLLTHAIAFALVNTFIWMQDMAISSGLDYAYWVTIPWAVGLAIHATVVWRERAKERATVR